MLSPLGLLKTVIAGGIGGVAFWVAIFPADVIKSRMQISDSNDSMMSVTKKVIKVEGLYEFLISDQLSEVSLGSFLGAREFGNRTQRHIT